MCVTCIYQCAPYIHVTRNALYATRPPASTLSTKVACLLSPLALKLFSKVCLVSLCLRPIYTLVYMSHAAPSALLALSPYECESRARSGRGLSSLGLALYHITKETDIICQKRPIYYRIRLK